MKSEHPHLDLLSCQASQQTCLVFLANSFRFGLGPFPVAVTVDDEDEKIDHGIVLDDFPNHVWVERLATTAQSRLRQNTDPRWNPQFGEQRLHDGLENVLIQGLILGNQ